MIAPAARATRLIFLLSGIGMASWAPMVPFAKANLGLDEASLGMVLLCMGCGATAAMPLAGFLTHRYGNRNVIGVSALLLCLALPLLTVAPSAWWLGAALLFFGATLGVVDVAMNAHAVDVEKHAARPMMSGFHGVFSIGGLVGSVVMSALLRAGAPLLSCAIAVSVLLFVVVATQWKHLLAHVDDESTSTHTGFRMPSPMAFLLGFLCMIVFLAEGAMLDWSAVFLRFSRGFDISMAGLGYAVFSVAMATGRLLGDRITAKLGPVMIVRLGSFIAAIGFVVATTLPWGYAGLLGFLLVGMGASNIVPVLFSAAGRLPGTSAGIAIATVTALGYAGMLAGPAVIGFAAHAFSLPVALFGIGVLLILVTLSANIARR
ncbi:putative MFS family arabinose efflux permease [Luteibacter sp. Sphag1AF]|uniref:MFS transporter n=1 Tax=Luteibacter sp. Sphag1AF TaxID=2587031 RepID=UPI00161651E2|nr:MFS transporter [Luteibacter sp. Sphag1AF]MBB3228477.1 putative MFS family arabinose efflux permease [Luteibacter sp. Sphag1AF]